MTNPFMLPPQLKAFFSLFPLHTYPPIPTWTAVARGDSEFVTLWIHPPLNPSSSLLSSEIECLKWQAYLALRGLSNILVRWDIAADGGLEGRLPNIHVPSNTDGDKLIAARMIPGWVDERLPSDPMEGYKDEKAKNESNAWVLLLEDTIHAALVNVLFLEARTTLIIVHRRRRFSNQNHLF
jgi:metaxin